MESSEGGDDQGSGWLQVKKKHRSSSKFSVHGWVGGLSVKQNSRNPRNQPSLGKLNNGYVGQSSKARNNVVFDPGKVMDSTNVTNKGVSVEDSDLQARVTQKLPQELDDNHSQKDNPAIIPKIKWGDLDDSTLLLHQGENIGTEIKFGRIECPNLICRKSEDADAFISYSTSSGPIENNFTATTVDQDHSLLASQSLLPRQNSLENNCKEANEVPSQDVQVQIVDEKIVDPNDSASRCHGHPEHKEAKGFMKSGCSEVSEPPVIDGNVKMGVFSPDSISQLPDESGPGATNTHSLSRENIPCQAPGEAVMIQAPAALYEACSSDVSKVSAIDGNSKMVMFPQDSLSLPPDKTGSGVTAEPTMAASVKDFNCQQGNAVLDDLTKNQIIDSISASGDESKERFRERLWCFLFENLNRAVDELYLLCELECDLEQMKEAILVLEEAASDFGELNARVEEFDKVKRSSSHLLDGVAPLTMKSDHRRPHSLSWEVRRMTTSPRRAEILSSSLEAFRKIQQERACSRVGNALEPDCHNDYSRSGTIMEKDDGKIDIINIGGESVSKLRKQHEVSNLSQGHSSKEKKNVDSKCSNSSASRLPLKGCPAAIVTGKNKRDLLGASSEAEKQLPKKDKMLIENMMERNPKSIDLQRRQIPSSEPEKEKRNANLWKSMDAWKEKRNWEDILAPPHRVSSRFSHSPGLIRKSAERARTLHDKLMSPEKKKKSALDLKKDAEEKHARAMRIRNELESERVQRLQRTSEKLNRVNEFQAERNMKLREVLYTRHQRSESRHEAFLAQVVRRANDESSKVNEVRFITSLNEENKKLILRQKLHDSELRRAEKLQLLKSKQKEDMAREEAVLERKKLLEVEKLQRIAEIQRKKEEAQVRREEERKASSAAREAKAIEQMRRKEVRAKAQQEEAELLAQKLAERLSESEQRRKFYLEQIREKASMDFRDQTSPFLRRSANKDGQGRSTPNSSNEDCQANNNSTSGGCPLPTNNMALQHSLKRRIKKIRQKLMALKHEYTEPLVGPETGGIGYRTAVGTARAKIGRWLQELQKLRQARKEGAASFGLITAEMIKFLEGRDAELQASRQAGLLDFIASALPASHTSKPEACQVTLCLLRLLRAVLSMPANRSYFLSQNLLPPIIPMLAAALENYIKIAASANVSGSTSLISSKSSAENLDSISEILDRFLWVVAVLIGHVSSDERQLQMQDGLLELVIAYQVIHRLRDLFALYDRPQVEGSPFPLSIILSIKLLAVLTSRFKNMSSIDWESFPCEMTSLNRSEEVKVAEAMDLIGLPDVPEDRPLDESLEIKRIVGLSPKRNADLSPQNMNSDEVECSGPMTGTADAKDKSNDITSYSVSLKDEEKSVDKFAEHKDEVRFGLKQPVGYLLSAISETGLVCLPSMLTAVLLQANNRLFSEQVPYILPSNFEEVATGVLKVLNNLAIIDIIFIQRMLARPDLKMEFFHLMSFILSHCTSKWGVATNQIGLLLLESLTLLGYFALFHLENQAVLRWGKSPTILHKVCDLPFVFFSDPELMPILAGTLIAACFGCEQNKCVILQELSMDMVLSLLKSCRNSSPVVLSISALDNSPPDENVESNHLAPESRKIQVDAPHSQRSHRNNSRNARTLSQKVPLATNIRTLKMRNQRENRVLKLSEEMGQKYNQYTSETSALMLHTRFPTSLIERAEQFFSAELTSFTENK